MLYRIKPATRCSEKLILQHLTVVDSNVRFFWKVTLQLKNLTVVESNVSFFLIFCISDFFDSADFFSVDFLFNSFTSYRSICSDVKWCNMKEVLYLKRQFTRNYKGCWLLKWEHVLCRCLEFGNVSNIILVWDIHFFLHLRVV